MARKREVITKTWIQTREEGKIEIYPPTEDFPIGAQLVITVMRPQPPKRKEKKRKCGHKEPLLNADCLECAKEIIK